MRTIAMMLMLVLFVRSAFAGDCVMDGQFVVVPWAGVSTLFVCQGGTTREFPAASMLASLERYRNDPQFMNYMKEMGVGGSYDEIKKNLDGAGLIRVFGEKKPIDNEALGYIAKKMNEQSGITEQALAAAKANRDKPVEMNPQTLTTAAQQNDKLAKSIMDNCRENSDQTKGLRVFKVDFGDDQPALLFPREVKKIGENQYEVTLQLYGTGFGGLQLGGGTMKRILKFSSSNQVTWVGKDGKEYPVKKMTAMQPNEALGFTRPFGWGNQPDSCLWAKHFKDDGKREPVQPTAEVPKAGG